MKRLLLQSKFLTSAFLLLALFFANGSFAQSGTVTSGVTGNWNADATWVNTNITRTGTVSCSTGSTTVTGTGTLFLTELTVGSVIQRTNGNPIGTVTAIASNTSLTLTANAGSNQTNQAYRTISGPPSPVDTVIIDDGDVVTVNLNSVCAALTIAGGGNDSTLAISGTNSLTVNGPVTINAGTGNGDDKLITVGSGSLSCTSISVTAPGSGARVSGVTVSTGTITVTGNVTLGSTDADFTFTGGGTLNVGGNMSGGTFTRSTGTVNYNGIGNQSIGAYTYYNLTTSGGSGTKSLVANTIVNGGNLNIGSGTTLDLLTFTCNRSSAGGTLTVAGTLALGATTGGETGSNFPSNFSTRTMTGGTVNYKNLAGGQTVFATPNYNNLTLSNTSGTQTTGGAITVNGALTTTAGGTLNMGTNQLLGSLTSVSNSGIIRTQNTGGTPIPSGKTWGGTVQYDGAGQTVVDGTYNNLNFAGSGTKDLTSALAIGGNLSIDSGVIANLSTFSSTANTLTLAGNGQLSGQYGGTTSGATYIIPTFFATATGIVNVAACGSGIWTGTTNSDWGTTTNWCDGAVPTASTNVTINSGGNQPVISAAAVCNSITLGSGSSLTINNTLAVSGSWTNNGSTITGTSNVTFNGIGTIDGTSATTFPNNLTITGTISQGNNVNVTGNFSQTAGTYNVSSSATSYTLAVTGNFSQSGGTFNVSNGANSAILTVGGTYTLSGGIFVLENTTSATGATVTVTGQTTISGTGIIMMDRAGSAATCNFNAVNFTASGTGGNTDDTNRNNCSIDFGLGTVVNHCRFNISGNFVHSSTNEFYTSATAQVGSIIFNGGGTQTFSYTGTNSRYTSYTVNVGATLQLLAGLTMENSSALPASTFTVNGTLDATTFFIAGRTAGGGTAAEVFVLAAGATLITKNPFGVVTTTSGTIRTTLGTRTFNNAANYVFNGTANQNTALPNLTVNNLTIANSGVTNKTVILTGAPTVNGTLAVNSGIFDAATFQIVGNATNNFTIASGAMFRMGNGSAFPTNFISANCLFDINSTVEYYALVQNVSNTPTYGNLMISSAGIKTASGGLDVNGDFLINTPITTIISGGTFTHTIGGDLINSGAFTSSTSTIVMDGTSPQIIGGTSASTFNNLIINNSTGVTLANNETINGTLTLTSGILDIANYNLTFGSAAAAVAGTLSATEMIIASGTGELRKDVTANSSFLFPIGEVTGTADYSPITLNVAGTGYASAYVGVKVTNAKSPDNQSPTDYLNRYWSVTQSGVTACTASATATYVPADIVGTEASIAAGSLDGTFNQSTNPWIKYSALASNTLTTSAATITAAQISQFTGITGANPTVNITGGGVTVCSGTNVNLGTTVTADPTVTYSWSPVTFLSDPTIANPVVTAPTATTSYTVTITDGNGITATSAASIITIDTFSVAPTGATGTTTICTGTSTTLTVDGGSKGTAAVTEWFTGSCGGTLVFTGDVFATGTLTSDTTYYVRYSGNCNDTTCATVNVTINTTTAWSASAANTTWTDAGNWTCGVPFSASDVTINAGTNQPTIASNVAINSLTIASSAIVTVTSGFDLLVTDVVANSGTLNIQNTANLLQVNNVSNTGAGTTNVFRNSSALKRLDYTMWSSPVTGSQTLLNFSPFTSSTRFYEYVTSTNLYAGISSSNTFDLAKGYLIRMPNNWTTWANVWSGQFAGVPNNGNINHTMSLSGTGFNAVGNPYPSALDIDAFITANTLPVVDNIDGTLWFWRKTNDSLNPVSYSTCTISGCTLNNGAVSDGITISTGQGFIVKAMSTTLNYTNSMRSGSNVNQFFKTAEKNRYWLELTNSDKVSFGQNLIAYLPNATLGYDNGYDGLFINDTKTTLLTNSGDKEVVIQARPEFDAQDVLPLILKVETAGTYTITLSDVDGIFEGNQNIYLNDRLENKSQNLNEGSYTFTADAGNFAARFDITYQKTLGVNQTDFNENNIVVYKQDQELVINTGSIMMSSVKVYDIRGRLLITKKGINATQTKIKTDTTNQVLMVKITSAQNGTVTKKVIN